MVQFRNIDPAANAAVILDRFPQRTRYRAINPRILYERSVWAWLSAARV